MTDMRDNFLLKQGENTVTIAGEVVASMAAAAAAEVENVTGMATAPQLPVENADNFVHKNSVKGVRVIKAEEDACRVELYVLVKMGAAVKDVASAIQDKVKYEVESATGLKVQAVDVYVAGISLKK